MSCNASQFRVRRFVKRYRFNRHKTASLCKAKPFLGCGLLVKPKTGKRIRLRTAHAARRLHSMSEARAAKTSKLALVLTIGSISVAFSCD
jgi:hypothetical protein